MTDNRRVCPVEHAGGLDNRIRRIFQNPIKILKPYLQPGITMLDLGCGPGFFTIPAAEIIGTKGKVIAVDLQEGMLSRLKEKITNIELEKRIKLHKCEESKIGVSEKVDVILAFYMVHEVPNQENLFKEIKSILKSGGKLLIVEPKFHVSKQSFQETMGLLEKLGYEVIEQPKIILSRAAFLKKY
ncbi:class I SAM-dependent methyltransferase [Desulfosporosinus sp. FKB]|uniref:class I SAM-dependent methyltransferase n=1 Tax=Desulfosporosinus sp. FKB TaxID=1969835 RepID=UPI000B4A41ED|nr:class I SAM-dependent methyltransferase [Desulfosporosinus sp. FKB]